MEESVQDIIITNSIFNTDYELALKNQDCENMGVSTESMNLTKSNFIENPNIMSQNENLETNLLQTPKKHLNSSDQNSVFSKIRNLDENPPADLKSPKNEDENSVEMDINKKKISD